MTARPGAFEVLARTAWVAWAAAAAVSPTVRAADLGLRRIEMKPEGRPDSVLTHDLDGDGLGDLLLRDRRRVSVFFLRPDGPPSTPDLAFDLPDDAVFVDLSDVDGDGAGDLALMTPEGVKVVRFTGREASAASRFEALCRDDLVLRPVPAADVRWSDVLFDIDGEGGEDALLATDEGYRVFLRGAVDGGFRPGGLVPVAPVGSIDLSPRSDLGVVSQTLEMPRVFTGDVEGDGRPELLTFDGRVVRVFARPPDDAPDGAWLLLDERALYDTEVSLPEEYLSSRLIEVADLDGDGRAGLMVVRSMEGALDFFATSDAGRFAERRTLQLEGWILPPDLIDLDGDGRVDLVAPTVEEIGYLKLAKIFVSQGFQMRFWTFKNRPGVRFARTPDEVREITVPLKYDTSGGRASVEYQAFHSFDGDFDGDGVHDFVVKTGADVLGVFRGTSDGAFSAEPDVMIEIPDASAHLSVEEYLFDLDRDGRCDLLLHYRGAGELGDEYRLLLSGSG